MTARFRGASTDDPEELAIGSGPENVASNTRRWDRAGSVVIGAALVARGLRRRSLRGATTAVAGGALLYRGLTGRNPLYRVLESMIEVERERVPTDGTSQPPTVERTVTVGEPADELATYWRDPSQLTRIVGDLIDVSAVDDADDRYHWQLQAPLGRTLEWETEIVTDEPSERLRWETLEGAPLEYDCTLSFQPAPGDRGTEVTLEISYDPPGGSIGDAAMRRLGFGPRVLAGSALQRFKSLAETGDIPSLEANPSGRGSGDRL